MAVLTPRQRLEVAIDKPAAGGRMIARVDGQVLLVAGAIPGEQAEVQIERVSKGVAYAAVVHVTAPSPDRVEPGVDPRCGGCLYGFIAYRRQLSLKAEVIGDALRRIARVPWPEAISVCASPPDGYRMRARLHWRQRRLGFFVEGSHDLCDARLTRQLGDGAARSLAEVERTLTDAAPDASVEVELSENVEATERAVHLEVTGAIDRAQLSGLAATASLTGLSLSAVSPATPPGGRPPIDTIDGSPSVTDRIDDAGRVLMLRRHVLSFFQGNRFLLAPLVAHVGQMLAPATAVIDLYAGAGLFSVAAALRGASVTAVEGDPVSARDLASNAAGHGVTPVHEAVEHFVQRRVAAPHTVIVDPPRTGMSREALEGLIRLRAVQVVYVSCDVATLARDTRRLLDAGYRLRRVDGFDLFPNTPHVETVAQFER